MDEEKALAAFQDFLARKTAALGEALGRVPIPGKRLSAGWAFYYQSSRYLETGEDSDRLVGQGPVVIRDDGTVLEGGSLDDAEDLLR